MKAEGEEGGRREGRVMFVEVVMSPVDGGEDPGALDYK